MTTHTDPTESGNYKPKTFVEAVLAAASAEDKNPEAGSAGMLVKVAMHLETVSDAPLPVNDNGFA
ncbi:MAG: hypothetical protein AAF988_07785 [Pseudomonadota bacterium]